VTISSEVPNRDSRMGNVQRLAGSHFIMNKLSTKDFNKSLIGLVMGDGHINGNRLIISHSDKQEFYIKWLSNLFVTQGYDIDIKKSSRISSFGKEFSYSTLKVYDIYKKGFIHNKNNRIYTPEGKKILTSYTMKNISPLGLLFWYLDDGNLSVHCKKGSKYNNTSRFACFATHSFSHNEQKTFVKYMSKRFDINCKIHTDLGLTGNRLYKIYIPAIEFRKFYDLVRDFLKFVPEEFNYKFNMKYTVNQMNSSEMLNYNGFISPNEGEAPRPE
jgi:hypothetical protein